MRRLSPDLSVLLLLAAGGFLGFLGQPPLFDWDEINFAEAAREMLITGNFLQVQIDFQPFWEKPPLFFWLQSLAMSWFGVGAYAARFPNAIIGILTIFFLYQTGSRWRNELFGRMVSLFYLATMLPGIYFKSGIIDPTFNFFIFLGIMNVMQVDDSFRQQRNAWKQALVAGIWIGVATLTKGPVALLVTGIIYGIYAARWHSFLFPWKGIGLFFLSFLGTVSIWYGLETLIHGPWFVTEFLSYQVNLLGKDVAGHAQPFYYHPIVFLLGCFPVAAFTFRAMGLKGGESGELLIRRLMIIWFWVIMVLFSIVKTKIVHYSSLTYFPASFLAADLVYRWIQHREGPRWDTWVLLGIGTLLWGLAPALINFGSANLGWLSATIKDPIASKAMLAEVSWTGWEWLIGAGCLISILVFLFQLYQRHYLKALWLQAVTSLVFLNLMFVFVAPKLGMHLQGAPQQFFTNLKDQTVYVLPARYKSYLPYFYAQTKPPSAPDVYNSDWLIHGKIDRDVYVSVQAHREDEAFRQQFRTFERIGEEDGFVFYIRRKSPAWAGD